MKFEKIDKKYLSERKKLSQKYVKENLWEIIDHWPLYVGNSNLQRFLTIYELLKTTLDIPGHIAEFGSWRGANTMFMAKVLNMLDPYSNKLVYAFDSFEGLTEFDRKDDHATSHEGSYKGNILELIDFMKLNNLEDNIVIQKGYIEKTLPVLLDADKALSFSMVYCDTDLYASTKVVLDYLHPRLVKGGLFVFDEWNHPNWPGETVAVQEFLDQYSDMYNVLHVKHTRQPTLALRKL